MNTQVKCAECESRKCKKGFERGADHGCSVGKNCEEEKIPALRERIVEWFESDSMIGAPGRKCDKMILDGIKDDEEIAYRKGYLFGFDYSVIKKNTKKN